MATYKTPFSKRCEILGNIWLFYSEDAKRDATWSEFFDIYDIGLPLAYFVTTGIASVKRGKESYVNDAWNDMCDIINVDKFAKYQDLAAIFAASPNEPLEDEEE